MGSDMDLILYIWPDINAIPYLGKALDRTKLNRLQIIIGT